jgi:hypothetical protein
MLTANRDADSMLPLRRGTPMSDRHLLHEFMTDQNEPDYGEGRFIPHLAIAIGVFVFLSAASWFI